MLDFENTEMVEEKNTRSTQIRHGETLATLIELAAQVLAVDKSTFLRNAINKEARLVLEKSTHHVLTQKDAALFQQALDTPPKPTPNALKAAKSYRNRVVHAD